MACGPHDKARALVRRGREDAARGEDGGRTPGDKEETKPGRESGPFGTTGPDSGDVPIRILEVLGSEVEEFGVSRSERLGPCPWIVDGRQA